MIDSMMIETYQLDGAYNSYDTALLDPVTQSDIDECEGFDSYGDYLAGKIPGPTQPDNAHYMKGWMKRQDDFFAYESWDSFCK